MSHPNVAICTEPTKMDDSFVLRMRKKPLRELVQDMDAFPKVVENAQEDKRAQGGALTVLCFLAVSWLVYGEIKWYLSPEYVYKFAIDTEHETNLIFHIDVIVNMNCDSIGADIIDNAHRSANYDQNLLQLTPTKYELSGEESKYWEILKHVQAERMRNPRKSLDDLSFVSSSVINKFKKAAHTKEKEKASEKKAATKDDNPMKELENIFGMMMGGMGGHGGGSIRIISMNGQVVNMIGGGAGGEGACRIQGKVPVSKVAGTFHVSPGKTMPMMGGGHAHMNFFGSSGDYNFSHRIIQLSFGPPVPGLVTPLDTTEKISHDHLDMYQYYIQIVPTRVIRSSGETIDTYQYSVTQQKRQISHDTGSHGMPGLNFKYELNSMAVTVMERKPNIFQFLVRLCAIVGGIVATSALLNSVLSAGTNFLWCRNKFKYEKVVET